jgi:hypothetical protein
VLLQSIPKVCCYVTTSKFPDSHHVFRTAYEKWNDNFKKASIAIENREMKLEEVAEEIEKNLTLLGVTAIEDKLQKVRFFSTYSL